MKRKGALCARLFMQLFRGIHPNLWSITSDQKAPHCLLFSAFSHRCDQLSLRTPHRAVCWFQGVSDPLINALDLLKTPKSNFNLKLIIFYSSTRYIYLHVEMLEGEEQHGKRKNWQLMYSITCWCRSCCVENINTGKLIYLTSWFCYSTA